MMCDEYEYIYKIIILGDSATGKSSYLHRVTTGAHLNCAMRSTIGVDFGSKIVDVNNTKIKLHMWDTAGQELYRSIVSSYYRQAVGILLFVDISQPRSFAGAERWIKDVHAHFGRPLLDDAVKIMVVANKCDLECNIDNFMKWVLDNKFSHYIISTKNDPIDTLEAPLIALADKINKAWPNGANFSISKRPKLQQKKKSMCELL
jgi:small GTP-binding protein